MFQHFHYLHVFQPSFDSETQAVAAATGALKAAREGEREGIRPQPRLDLKNKSKSEKEPQILFFGQFSSSEVNK